MEYPLLTIAAILLCAWVAYRAERQLWAERLKLTQKKQPCESAAMLAAMSAMTRRAETAITDLVKAKRPEPLPGTQNKPKPRKRARSVAN